MTTATPTHELVTNKNGTISLRELRSGEVMHSNVGPREEATLLYIEQSKLGLRLADIGSGPGVPLVLYDVGLGAGTNALAALQCHRATASPRPLQLLSFENDPTGFAMAIEHRDKFPFFEGFEEAARRLLSHGEWRSQDGLVHWQLFSGDFRATVAGLAAPDLVFYDFYSPRTVPELWNIETFKTVLGPATSLFTYSASTRVRLALLLAGFYVGYGRNTGAKNDTTVAATKLEDLERPLDQRWLERLGRSHKKTPYGWEETREAETLALVHSHAQFRQLAVSG